MVPTVLCYLISTSSTIYSFGGQSSAPPIATWGGMPIFTPVPVFTPVPLWDKAAYSSSDLPKVLVLELPSDCTLGIGE
ncbi:hypothetical protein AVEN_31782-1 [Araneus ventricosus]|uniref:Uncharacterized protein n=1 Tax=Araneus ventricosus TaxID=182803 RepID=A0A4Y2JSU8_ARAVE|nr:hypothetical protein AVEN_31782-1 [Araneus ventricosus]